MKREDMKREDMEREDMEQEDMEREDMEQKDTERDNVEREDMEMEEEGNEEILAEDIYRFYMEEVAAIPACSETENARLLLEVKKGSEEARKRMIEGNLRIALLYVREYLNRGVAMADLIQEASMELMMLVDEGLEGSFERLLESRIRVRMEEVIKEQKAETEIAEEMLARVNVLQEVSKRMAEELGREASLKELAERMKMTEDDVREIMKVTMDALSLGGANRSLQS